MINVREKHKASTLASGTSGYFNMKDISRCFGIERLYDILIDNKNDNYEEGKHYIYFM